jgi:hypothetical protein
MNEYQFSGTSESQSHQWTTKNSPAWAAKQSSRNMAGAISKSFALAERKGRKIKATNPMRNLETELIGGEIHPTRDLTTRKDWLEAIAFGILYVAIIYGLILFLAN